MRENIAYDDVDELINDDLEDEWTDEEDKKFLNSLTSEDKMKIAEYVINDSELGSKIYETIRYYVYHYRKI